MNNLERRIIELSYRHKRSHVSSALNTVNVLAEIYKLRQPNEPVILANSHASLALFVVLESNGLCNAEEMITKHGTHASRDMEHGIWCSGGSLGQPEGVAAGFAMADRSKRVWLVTSDGACAEGSVWESFALASDLNLTNLFVTVVANGFGAYCQIDVKRLSEKLKAFLGNIDHVVFRPVMPFPWLEGLPGHYLVLNDEQYAEAMRC